MAFGDFRRTRYLLSEFQSRISFGDWVGVMGLTLLYDGMSTIYSQAWANIVIGGLLILFGFLGAVSQSRSQ